MKTKIIRCSVIGFVFTSAIGTLLHYLYDWTGESIITAPFSSVNESTWEHMKLLFIPLFAFAIVQSFFFKDREDFWWIKLKGTLLGVLMIPVLFYVYNGAIGKSPDWINISIFFVCAAITYIYEARAFMREEKEVRVPMIPFFLLCTIFALFIIFTFITPELPLFADPNTGIYGISK